MLAMVLVLLTQLPCSTAELASPVCSCKQGRASACEALRQTDAALANALEAAAQVVMMAKEEKGEAVEAASESSAASSEPPDCKGQLHHVISKRIAKALEDHGTLGGHYRARDPRFVTRAVDEKAHCGYQDWHRKVDDEVIAWLDAFPKATPAQFEAFLREVYSRASMSARFPHGF